MHIQNPLGKIDISKRIVSKIILDSVQVTVGTLIASKRNSGRRVSWFGSRPDPVDLQDSPQGLDIHVSVLIRHRLNMPEVCRRLQANIREKVEAFTGLPVGRVNVTIEGVFA
ncbi:Asp23/Gls24 family envelope stress response protein [Saccharibacillus sp. O23]|uniref:Asp23/Gls24 family envelope stress response protein n=1 Tax=Saccharibacillus sp. O23 TaxID=2009338 RepID=UPI0015C5EF1D|nr:Asp23/Gls24 family envelope stress response protein [Saccharibacillus sp. O23]